MRQALVLEGEGISGMINVDGASKFGFLRIKAWTFGRALKNNTFVLTDMRDWDLTGYVFKYNKSLGILLGWLPVSLQILLSKEIMQSGLDPSLLTYV